MPNEDRHSQAKSHGISNFALTGCFVRFRLFADFASAMTHEMTLVASDFACVRIEKLTSQSPTLKDADP